MNAYQALEEIDARCFVKNGVRQDHYPNALLGDVIANHGVTLPEGHVLRPIDLGPPRGGCLHKVVLLQVNGPDGDVARVGLVDENWVGTASTVDWQDDLDSAIAVGEAFLDANAREPEDGPA